MDLSVLSFLIVCLAIADASVGFGYYPQFPKNCYPNFSMCESKCHGHKKACHQMPALGPEWYMCEEVECENPDAPEHGHVTTPHGIGFESIAVYSCEEHYDLSYPAYRTCLKSGKWSGHVPHCDPRPECEDLDDPEHGDVTLSDGTYQGSLANFSCDADYVLSDASVLVCLSSGYWSGWLPSCIPIAHCDELEDPEHGTVHYTSIKKWSKAYYTCEEGYVLSYVADRVCLSTGRWSGDKPTCDEVDCGVLEHPCNGLVLTPDGTTLDDEATYVCHFGYELSEDVVRTCESGGHWSGEAPCCDPIQCPNPPDLTNGMITTPGGHGVGNIAYYMCNPCYSVVGPKKRTCLADGTWSGPDPACQLTKPLYLYYFQGSCYRLYHSNVEWPDALAQCKDDGAYMVEIMSAAEQNFIESIIGGSSGNWWMGLTDDFDEMYWVWYESNAPYCYENWMPGEPDDDSPDKSGGADCAAMIGSDNLRWRSRHCELSYKFICEYNPESD